LKACKIVNFKPGLLKLWKRVFLMINSKTKQKQFSVHRHFKGPENSREGVCVEVGEKAVLSVLSGSFPRAFQRGENIRSSKREYNCVPVDVLRIQDFGDLVQRPSKPKI